MVKNVKIILAALAIIVLIVGAAGFGLLSKKETKANASATKEFITLKTTGSLGASATIIDIAEEKGFLEEQGIKLERIGAVQGGTEAVQALITGSIDIAGSAWQPWINAVNRGSKLKVVVAGQGQNAKEPGILWIVKKNSSIRSAKDLVGKKLAVNVLGAEADYVTRAYLKQNGLSIEQVQLIVVPWPQHEQVFKSEQVEMVATNTPFSDKILEGGDARVLFSNYDIRGETALYVYGVREDLIVKNPQAVRKFVTAIAKAYDWSAENPEEARKVVAEIYKKNGNNPELAKYWSPRIAWEHGLIKDKDVQWWLDVFVGDGKLQQGQIKPSDIYTNEFNPYFKK